MTRSDEQSRPPFSIMRTVVIAEPEQKPAKHPAIPFPWTPDNGDGTFSNPVICADYSDPDIVRVGDDFYMTASSFNCTPGLPLLHSKDLVNWTLIGHALKNVPHPRYAEFQPGCGVWAPSIRHHAGKFWIFFPTPDEGFYLTTATNITGPWSDPHLVQAGGGLIDPCPLWDDDGKAWLVHAYAGSRAGIKHVLRVRPMSPDGTKLLGEGEIVFTDPTRHPTMEGPKFLKKDGWYYILAPAGGVATGWQVVLRSKNVYGPYEDKIVLEQGGTTVNGPHQGALVDTANGEWWFAHFQDAGLYGRIMHVQPVRWQDGWPLMGEDKDGNGIGEPVMRLRKPVDKKTTVKALPQTSDEFDSPTLGLQWQWHANHADNWCSLTERKSHLRLFAQSATDFTKAPSVLQQKFPARAFVVETQVEFSPKQIGEEAGLAVMGRDSAALVIRHSDTGRQFVWRHNAEETVIGDGPDAPLKIRVSVADGGDCTFSYDAGDGFVAAPESFKAREGVWIGAKVGIFCIGATAGSAAGHADFDYFRFSAHK